MPLISSFKQVQYYVFVLFFGKLFQSIFARYVLICFMFAFVEVSAPLLFICISYFYFCIKMDVIMITETQRFVYVNIVN